MTADAFRPLGEGRYQVIGRMTFETAGNLWEQSRDGLDGLNGKEVLTIDLGEVTEVDSAGLALLLEWIRSARQKDLSLRLMHLPDKLLALARISEVENLLGIHPEGRHSSPAGSSSSNSSSG